MEFSAAVAVIWTIVVHAGNQRLMFVAGSGQRSTRLVVTKVKRVPDTSIIESTSTSVSLIQCSFLCSEIDSQSLYFLADVQKCHCNEGIDSRNVGTTTDTITYAYLEKKNHPATMRQTCSSSAGCTTPSSGCYRSQCWCNRGHSYYAAIDKCVTECANYGSTFQADFGLYLLKNAALLVKANNETECQKLCINSSSIVCRTAEYWSYFNKCYISERTALSPGVTITVSAAAVGYQRDCA